MDPVGGKLHASLDLYPGLRGRSVVFGKFRLPALIMRIVWWRMIGLAYKPERPAGSGLSCSLSLPWPHCRHPSWAWT